MCGTTKIRPGRLITPYALVCTYQMALDGIHFLRNRANTRNFKFTLPCMHPQGPIHSAGPHAPSTAPSTVQSRSHDMASSLIASPCGSLRKRRRNPSPPRKSQTVQTPWESKRFFFVSWSSFFGRVEGVSGGQGSSVMLGLQGIMPLPQGDASSR